MLSNSSGVLFFGAEGQKSVTWNDVSSLEDIPSDTWSPTEEEQSKIFATMRNSQTMAFNCHISKGGIKSLMETFKRFKLAKGPERKRMILRARKMQTNYIYTYTFRKEGYEYVDERGQVRLVLQ